MAAGRRVSLILEDDLYRLIEQEAEDAGRPISGVIRDRLREAFFEAHEEQPIRGIGDLAERLLMQGLSNEAAREKVLEAFPDARTSLASIAWYRSNLRRKGKPVISQVDARRRSDPD